MQQLDSNTGTNRTSGISQVNGSHVVYTYTDIDKYIQNAVSYIAEGIDKHETVLYTDKPEYLDVIQKKLKDAGYTTDQVNEIIFVDANQYYAAYDVFDTDRVQENFRRMVYPYLHENRAIRTWGHFTWKKQDLKTLMDSLALCESNLDSFVSKSVNVMFVCAYDGLTLPASFLNEILRSHEYYMTDADFSASYLYKKKPIEFPAISEQIKAEKQVQDQVIRSEELTAAGELAASIAHELRNPLTVAKGYLQLIDKTADLYDKGKKYLNTVSGEMEKIERISSEFLSLAKPQSEHKQEMDIIQLVEDVKVLMEPQALKKTIDIHLEADHDDMTVVGDKMKIKQVIVNVIKNAIEAMSSGSITLGVKNVKDDCHILITDNGPGIPDEILNQLGKSFYTTKETGTGLGLLISEKIIENHNGTLLVESTVGKGTTFTISLPKEY